MLFSAFAEGSARRYSRHIFHPSIDRYIDRHLIDMSICRPTVSVETRPTDALSTHDPNLATWTRSFATHLCAPSKRIKRKDRMLSFYKRYVDDTLNIVLDVTAATAFLETLNNCHPSIQFTWYANIQQRLPIREKSLQKTNQHRSPFPLPTPCGQQI